MDGGMDRACVKTDTAHAGVPRHAWWVNRIPIAVILCITSDYDLLLLDLALH